MCHLFKAFAVLDLVQRAQIGGRRTPTCRDYGHGQLKFRIIDVHFRPS